VSVLFLCSFIIQYTDISNSQTKECLYDKEILECLKLAVGKAKKTVVKGGDSEVKAAATEFDDFVASILNDDAENVAPLSSTEDNSQPGTKKTITAKKSAKKASSKPTKRKAKKVEEWEEERGDEEEDVADSESDDEQAAEIVSKKSEVHQSTGRSKRGVLKASN
jgi:hypothetical protein